MEADGDLGGADARRSLQLCSRFYGLVSKDQVTMSNCIYCRTRRTLCSVDILPHRKLVALAYPLPCILRLELSPKQLAERHLHDAWIDGLHHPLLSGARRLEFEESNIGS